MQHRLSFKKLVVGAAAAFTLASHPAAAQDPACKTLVSGPHTAFNPTPAQRALGGENDPYNDPYNGWILATSSVQFDVRNVQTNNGFWGGGWKTTYALATPPIVFYKQITEKTAELLASCQSSQTAGAGLRSQCNGLLQGTPNVVSYTNFQQTIGLPVKCGGVAAFKEQVPGMPAGIIDWVMKTTCTPDVNGGPFTSFTYNNGQPSVSLWMELADGKRLAIATGPQGTCELVRRGRGGASYEQ